MSHVVNVPRHNTKLGSIPCVNLPAVVPCRPDAPCAKLTEEGGGCYCLKGRWLFKNVQKSLWNNLYAYRENPKLYFEMIVHQFQFSTVARFHSSGDIVDEEYLAGMCWVARKRKNTHILVFTKKFELVNSYIEAGHRIPKNLHIIYSTWDNFIPENPYNLPMAYVKFKDESRNAHIPEKAFECPGKCEECLYCFYAKKGQNVFFKKH